MTRQMTIRKFLEGPFNEQRTCSDKVLDRKYRDAVSALERFGIRNLKQLTDETLIRFDEWLETQALSTKTVNARYSCIRTLWRSAVAAGLAPNAPTLASDRRGKGPHARRQDRTEEPPAVAPDKHEWHRRPKSFADATCPICGLRGKIGEHRAVRDDEGLNALWIRRRKTAGGWKLFAVGKRAKRRDETPEPPPPKGSIRAQLEAYLLRTEVRNSTAVCYRRVVNVFCNWYGTNVPEEALTADTLNRFLRDKQEEGASSYYRRSLRSALVAILRDHSIGKVRPTKLEPLTVHCWDASEVARLVDACDVLPAKHREYYRQAIIVAYHTGLSQIDIHRLERSHVDASGTIRLRRSKTGNESVVTLPPDVVAQLPAKGLLVPPKVSREMFRRHFQKIVAAAGLKGTFKTLRTSSGTAAELITGKGHEHLANSRKIFEKHYLDSSKVGRVPVRLELKLNRSAAEPAGPTEPAACGRSPISQGDSP